MSDEAALLQEQIAEKERQMTCLMLESHAQSQNRLRLKVLQNQLILAKVAWWRGKKVAAAGHSIKWYTTALTAYSESERAAFLVGYNGLPCPE